ncbi:MAG: molybdopterin-dependent oxidoreductase [Pseudomonadota bacterium]
MDRREFIKLAGTLAGGAVVGPALLNGCSTAPPPPGSGEVKTTPTICDICFWKCAALVHTEDGRPWKVTGHPEDLHSGGRLCTRGTGGLGAYLDRDRLKRPLLRVDKGGKQRFEPVSWDEALGFIAQRMQAIAEKHGPDRMALFSHGASGAHFRHLLRAYGCESFAEASFAQCRGPREVAFYLTFGETLGGQDRTDMAHSRCIVLLGYHLGENLHNAQVQTFAQAMRNGATIITVDPRFSVAASKSTHWLAIKPGTDLALLLTWINVIISEGLYDKSYVQQHTQGFEQLAAHVRTHTPEWAYLETGIDPNRIYTTAREMAKAAPATLVHPGRHVSWYGDDTQRERAIAILNALLGSWGCKGGFYNPETVALPKYPLPPYPKPASTWEAAHAGRYPMAYTGVTNALIEHSIGPDAHYRAWIVSGTNLPLSVPGIGKSLQQAADSLDLIVAVDIIPSEVTGYADVILPECTYLERYDDLRNAPERRPSLALRMPAFEPKYDSKPGWWICRELGLRLGLKKYFPWKDYTEVLDWQLKQVGSSLQEMQRLGVKNFPRQTPLYLVEGQGIEYPTLSGKIELYSTELKELGFDPLPRYTAPVRAPAGHLRLIYGRAPAHTFGRTSNNPMLFELMPENILWVHPLVAAEQGLKSGDYVRLKNQDGVTSLPIRVRVTERIRPDSVFMAHGFGHTSRNLRLTYGVGANDASLLTHIKTDPIMGATGMRSNFVTLGKMEA